MEPSDDSLDALTALGESLTGIYHPESVVKRFIQAIHQLLSPDQILVVLNDPLGQGAHLLIEAYEWPGAGPEHPAVRWVREQGSVCSTSTSEVTRLIRLPSRVLSKKLIGIARMCR